MQKHLFRSRPLASAVAASLALITTTAASHSPVAISDAPTTHRVPVGLTAGNAVARYIVRFTEPALASFNNSASRKPVNGVSSIPSKTYPNGRTRLDVGSAPGSWQNGFFATTSGVMTNFCAVTNNQLAVTGFKLEASSTATYLSVKSFESDLHDAIRYYSTSFNYQVTNAGVPLVGF